MCTGTIASAKTVSTDRVPVDSSTVVEDSVIYAGPIGATLETDYFKAPAQRSADRCRMQLYFSGRPVSLARACD